MKIALGVEYCGQHYHGWQKQPDALNVQGHVELALSNVADDLVEIVCAGRTDTGVHGLGQVVHFKSTVMRTNRAWVLGANTHLPNDIRITWAKQMPEDFHARFSAIARRYTYVLQNAWVKPGVFHGHQAWHCKPLVLASMQKAAAYLLGEHDFTSFRGIACQAKSPIRHIQRFDLQQKGDFFLFTVKANAFLYHMVRNLVGTLLKVGEGQKSPEWVRAVLAEKDRRAAGITAPSAGLYFCQAYYPEPFELPKPRELFFCE